MKYVNEIKGRVGFAAACAVAAIGVAIMLGPTAGANTDPGVPYGATPTTSTASTYHIDDQDEVDTSGGFVDRPF